MGADDEAEWPSFSFDTKGRLLGMGPAQTEARQEEVKYEALARIDRTTDGLGQDEASRTPWFFGTAIVLAIAAAVVGSIVCWLVVSSHVVPIIAPTGTFYSETALPGANYYELLQNQAIQLDMTSLPQRVDPSSVRSSLFPSNAQVTCDIIEPLRGDMCVASQNLQIVEIGTSGQIVSIGVQSLPLRVIPVCLLVSIVSLVVAAINGMSLMAWFAPRWDSVTVERIVRVVVMMTFLVMETIGTIVTVSLIGDSGVYTLAGMGIWGAANGVAFMFVVYIGYLSHNRLSSPMRDSQNSGIAIRRILKTTSVVVIASMAVKAVLLIFRLYNWWFVGVLTDWAPAYTPGLGAYNQAAVWVFLLGTFLVVFGTFMILAKRDLIYITFKLEHLPENFDSPRHIVITVNLLLWMNAGLVGVLVVFNTLVYFGKSVGQDLAC
jgi:hypothetical protein